MTGVISKLDIVMETEGRLTSSSYQLPEFLKGQSQSQKQLGVKGARDSCGL